MKLPILYGKASTGKIKLWSIEAEKNENNTAFTRLVFGYIDGKKQTKIKPYLRGKNIGKANETSPYQQALSEARSKWNKQVDKGYVEDKNNIPSASDVSFFLPMLAHSYDKHPHRVRYPCGAQYKYDGARCLSKKENEKITLWTRKGKIIDTLGEISQELSAILKEGNRRDGEIYVHGWTFQRIISAIKKRNEDTPFLKYKVYDSPVKELTFVDRFITPRLGSSERVHLSEVFILNDENDLNRKMEEAIALGYEGLMIRNLDGVYKFKNRSYDLLKVKIFEDDEFEIIGGREAENDVGTVIFRCQTKEGNIFDVRPRGSAELRGQYLADLNTLINKPLTVRFQGYTNDGIPRFPVGIIIRDYE